MVLYPPVIDKSNTMQTGTGSVRVYYTYEGTTPPQSFEVKAINPRTGASVRTTEGNIAVVADNNYIDVAISGNIAQISLRAVYGEGQVSIASQAVIFKLFNETLNITWPSDKNIVSSPYRLMATLTSNVASDSLAWYQITVKTSPDQENIFHSGPGGQQISKAQLEDWSQRDSDTWTMSETPVDSSGYVLKMGDTFYIQVHCREDNKDYAITATVLENYAAGATRIRTKNTGYTEIINTIFAKTDKCFPTAPNTIDEILDYDFLCDTYNSYMFKITACTTNGILITKYATFTNGLKLTNSTKAAVSQSSNNLSIAWSNQTQGTSYTAKLYYADGKDWKVKETKTGVSIAANGSGSTTFTNLKTRATKYRAVLYNSSSAIVQATDIFWHAAYGQDILLKQDAQTSYLIKYNPEINQVKRNIVDVITPTLGAQYPFVYRNGHQNYSTFTIGGLIARYDNTKDVTYLGTDEDIIQERIYREDLLDFLYNDKIKLFSSAQEGEMLIKLSGVSVTPMKQLGRMLYSFSATATEIADCTEENLEAFGIEG